MGKQEEMAEEGFFTEDAAHDKHPKSCLPQLGSRQTVWAKTGIAHSLTPALLGGNPNSLSMPALFIHHTHWFRVGVLMYVSGHVYASGHVWRSKNSLRGQVPPSPIWVLVIGLRLSGLVARAMKSQLKGKKTQHCFCLFVYVCVCVYVCTLTLRGHIKANVKFFCFSLYIFMCVTRISAQPSCKPLRH